MSNPIDFFDNLRYWGERQNPILKSLMYYRGANLISQTLANLILPGHFRRTARREEYRLAPDGEKLLKSPRIIVSMTSFPARIKTTWLAVESILRQSVKPDKLLLCLTKEQIPDVQSLPKELLAQRERGLEIILCEETIRSHTKYWNAFRDYPEDIIVTVDDDVFYRSDLLETLLDFHKKHPQAIIANWAKKVQKDSDGTSVYAHWPEAKEEDTDKEAEKYSIFGVGGVLYPPHCMAKDLLNPKLIKELSFTADDLWLSAQAIRAGTKFVFTNYKQHHLPVEIRNNVTLISGNYVLNQKCVEKINAYYMDKDSAPLC